jgi:hypothetical protein
MIDVKKIENLSLSTIINNKVQLKYMGWEEPNRGQELVYYSVLINNVDKTEELFSAKTIQCLVNEKIELAHPTKNFAFIPCIDSILINTSDYTKTNLKVYFRENGNTIKDVLVGSFFYSEHHLTINKRSLIVTDLLTLENIKIKFEKEIDIEWAFFINPSQIQIIQAYSNLCFIYDLDEQKIIDRRNIIDNFAYPDIFRWIYRGQKYNSNEVEIELLQKKDEQFISTYFKINYMSSYFNKFQDGIFIVIKLDNKLSIYFGENSWWLLDDWENDIFSNTYLQEIESLKIEFENINEAYKTEGSNLVKSSFNNYLPSLYIDFDSKELYSNYFDQAIENRISEGWKGFFIENQNKFLELIPKEGRYWEI